MNIASIGPNLRLAPDADPTNGWLDLVLVAENDRSRLRDYVQHLTMTAAGAQVHVDDCLESPHETPSAVGGRRTHPARGGLEFLTI